MPATKRKAPPMRIAQPKVTHSAKQGVRARLNEAKASVGLPSAPTKDSAPIEISSGEEDEDEDEDEEADDGEEDAGEAVNGSARPNGKTNGTATSGVAADDNDNNEDDDAASDGEPTFGDLVREHETIDIAAVLAAGQKQKGLATDDESSSRAVNGAAAGDGGAVSTTAAAAAAAKQAAAPTSLASLGHLLNAALRTGDDANLEVCFHTTNDPTWIRNTIQRLDPALAAVLLQKLTARIHRRPGRAHILIGWVQWTLVAHGGAMLAAATASGHDFVTRTLQDLDRVLDERARGLNSLLLLKGKLDMLEAQMQMRRLQRVQRAGAADNATSASRSLLGNSGLDNGDRAAALASRSRRRTGRGGRAGGDGDLNDEDDEALVATFVEGRDDAAGASAGGQVLVNGALASAADAFAAGSGDEEELDDDGAEDSEEDEEDDDEDDEDDDEDDDPMDLLDDEAEEDDEDEVDFDDEDDEEDDEDEDADEGPVPPPAKVQKKSGGAFSKRR